MSNLPANRAKTGESRDCKACGSAFYVQQSRAGFADAAYCSRSCYMTARWSVGTCLECGAECAARYCSDNCKTTANARRKQEGHWKVKTGIIAELGGACASCGQSDIRVLELNHIDPSTKIRAPKGAWSWGRRIKDWQANAGNLEVLCANCHRLHTWKTQGHGVGLDF